MNTSVVAHKTRLMSVTPLDGPFVMTSSTRFSARRNGDCSTASSSPPKSPSWPGGRETAGVVPGRARAVAPAGEELSAAVRGGLPAVAEALGTNLVPYCEEAAAAVACLAAWGAALAAAHLAEATSALEGPVSRLCGWSTPCEPLVVNTWCPMPSSSPDSSSDESTLALLANATPRRFGETGSAAETAPRAGSAPPAARAWCAGPALARS
mmetsp:Transcript_16732/g.63351  ORF Transcript_16732/g.63351 Transcript_16732/m.63351 type:complete len:210 (-) Transcript_16732:677-1306(-)